MNEDGFFILRKEVDDFLKGAKNTEQQVQLDSEQKQGTFDNPVDASLSAAPRELT
jgi:hypothetical protein